MTKRNVRDIREAFYLFAGIVYGALLGFIGSIYGNWFYDTYKGVWWFPFVLSASIGVFLGIIIYMVYWIHHWTGILKHPEG
jgi:uncharacterized membrane protein YeaQ/YmgE (transglycosylase-associated protein family)